MDGRGRALDNVFIERLWRSLKYELIYPGDFVNGADLFHSLDRYFHFYNHQRPHQALGYRTPADLFPRRPIRKRLSPSWGALPPHTPQDLSLFSSRVDGLASLVILDCRTMPGLDWRIGQRRDATRAPIQARSGWRPSGRLLDSPPHHLRTAEILSKQPGPPQGLRVTLPLFRSDTAAPTT